MSHSNSITITRQALAAALVQFRNAFIQDPSITNAVNKAAIELEAQPWAFDGATLQIRSRTDSATMHRTDGTTCTCKAYNQPTPRMCWHRAAWMLLCQAAPLVRQSATYRTGVTRQQATADAAALFA